MRASSCGMVRRAVIAEMPLDRVAIAGGEARGEARTHQFLGDERFIEKDAQEALPHTGETRRTQSGASALVLPWPAVRRRADETVGELGRIERELDCKCAAHDR